MRYRLSLALVLAVAACGGGESAPPDAAVDAATFDAPWPGTGRIHVSWTVNDINGPTTCAAVGATHVFLKMSLLTGEQEYDIFPCADGQGTSQDLDSQTYVVTADLIDMIGGIYAGSLDSSLYVPADGSTVEMDPVAFMVQPTGGFELTLEAGFPGGNCGDSTAGGAGMTGTTYRLLNADAQCVLRQMQVAAGPTSGTAAGMYDTECTSDAPSAPCVENDQVVSMSNLPPGSYNIEITGWVGTHNCFVGRKFVSIDPAENVVIGPVTYMRNVTDPTCPTPP